MSVQSIMDGFLRSRPVAGGMGPTDLSLCSLSASEVKTSHAPHDVAPTVLKAGADLNVGKPVVETEIKGAKAGLEIAREIKRWHPGVIATHELL
jgi:hypothetical protein